MGVFYRSSVLRGISLLLVFALVSFNFEVAYARGTPGYLVSKDQLQRTIPGTTALSVSFNKDQSLSAQIDQMVSDQAMRSCFKKLLVQNGMTGLADTPVDGVVKIPAIMQNITTIKCGDVAVSMNPILVKVPVSTKVSLFDRIYNKLVPDAEAIIGVDDIFMAGMAVCFLAGVGTGIAIYFGIKDATTTEGSGSGESSGESSGDGSGDSTDGGSGDGFVEEGCPQGRLC